MNQLSLIQNYLTDIWNDQAFDKLDVFLHPEFQDHSLPLSFPSGKAGTQKWIEAMSLSFAHHTTIAHHATEGTTSILRINMRLRHTGEWRGIAPAGKELEIVGYREFRFKDGKIIAHHALMDGDALEKALLQQEHGCRVKG